MRIVKKRNVQIYSPCKALEFDSRAVAAIFHFLDETVPYRIPPGELSLAFLNQEAHGQLHADFLDDPGATDVITFPGETEEGMAGEICVSIDTAKSYSESHNIDFSAELCLYLIHGWLHLAGFDDLSEKDHQAMKKEEQVCLSALETKGIVPLFKYKTND